MAAAAAGYRKGTALSDSAWRLLQLAIEKAPKEMSFLPDFTNNLLALTNSNTTLTLTLTLTLTQL